MCLLQCHATEVLSWRIFNKMKWNWQHYSVHYCTSITSCQKSDIPTKVIHCSRTENLGVRNYITFVWYSTAWKSIVKYWKKRFRIYFIRLNYGSRGMNKLHEYISHWDHLHRNKINIGQENIMYILANN